MIFAKSLDIIKEFVYPAKNPDNLPPMEFLSDVVLDLPGSRSCGYLQKSRSKTLFLNSIKVK